MPVSVARARVILGKDASEEHPHKPPSGVNGKDSEVIVAEEDIRFRLETVHNKRRHGADDGGAPYGNLETISCHVSTCGDS